MIQIADPNLIPLDKGPYIVSESGTDWISKAIQWRTKSWCNHSMLCINPGKLVWEGMNSWYGEGPMSDYMKPGICLKFYSLVNINPAATQALHDYVAKRIASPNIDKMYDWIGIVGEAIGFPKIHTPGLEYCSVDAIHALDAMASKMTGDDQTVINNIPEEENPGYLDSIMVHYKNVFNFEYQYNYGAKV